jgi:hypothetical protein
LKELSQDKNPGSFQSTYEQLQERLKTWSDIDSTADITYKSNLKKGLSQYYRGIKKGKNVGSGYKEVQSDKNLKGRNDLTNRLITKSEEDDKKCKEDNEISKELITEQSSIKDIMYLIYYLRLCKKHTPYKLNNKKSLHQLLNEEFGEISELKTALSEVELEDTLIVPTSNRLNEDNEFYFDLSPFARNTITEL